MMHVHLKLSLLAAAFLMRESNEIQKKTFTNLLNGCFHVNANFKSELIAIQRDHNIINETKMTITIFVTVCLLSFLQCAEHLTLNISHISACYCGCYLKKAQWCVTYVHQSDFNSKGRERNVVGVYFIQLISPSH